MFYSVQDYRTKTINTTHTHIFPPNLTLMAILVSGACKHRSITRTNRCLCLVAMSTGGLNALDSVAGRSGESFSSMFSNTFTYFRNGVFFPKLNSVSSIDSVDKNGKELTQALSGKEIYVKNRNISLSSNPPPNTRKINRCSFSSGYTRARVDEYSDKFLEAIGELIAVHGADIWTENKIKPRVLPKFKLVFVHGRRQ